MSGVWQHYPEGIHVDSEHESCQDCDNAATWLGWLEIIHPDFGRIKQLFVLCDTHKPEMCFSKEQ